MDDTLAQLEVQYCPPLDPALLSAILSDYDLADIKNLEEAKKTLDELKKDALLNEAAEFDPSGTGAAENGLLDGDRTESHADTSASLSRKTDSSGLSNELSSLGFEDDTVDYESNVGVNNELEDFDKLDEAAKIQRLQSIFGDQINRYSIQYTLRKCGGNWNAAVEDLLNQAYLLDSKSVANFEAVNNKGVDAFSEENIVRRGRKGKAKNQRLKNTGERRSSSLPGLYDGEQPPVTNKWKSAKEDVEFIASRTGIATATVFSIYYEKGASMSQTIAALLKASMAESKRIGLDEVLVASQAYELGRDFPTISAEYLNVLVRLTYPSTASAHELATVLTSKPKVQNGGGVQIIPRSTPLEEVITDSSWSGVSKKAKSAASSRSSSSDMASAAARRDEYALARAAAFSQASAAHRKAKSDRLMGGAAAYYGQVGREYAALSSSASVSATDALVASQSTPTQLDLHGVDVANAVRIAQERVEEWWDGLGEARVNGRIGAEDRQTGYRIVVGLGRHSEGGRGKLGPAVMKMLKHEGWRVESAGAVIVVKGPLKRQ